MYAILIMYFFLYKNGSYRKKIRQQTDQYVHQGA